MNQPDDGADDLTGGNLLVRGIGRLLPMANGPWAVEEAALLITQGRVRWWGTGREADRALADIGADIGAERLRDLEEFDAEGGCVLPGFVDPHTHLAWAGTRREEFEARLAGEAYDGGGIAATVAATTACPTEELKVLMQRRVAAMLRHGTTTAEVKTGYGLDPAEELRQLAAVCDLSERTAMRIDATYLVHAIPAGADRAEHVAASAAALPEARRRGARWADVFCDEVAFTVGEARTLLTAAASAGLGLRLHADQLVETGAAHLAAELHCASADHLDRVSPSGAAALAHANTVAVLMPTASLSTRGEDWTYARRLRAAGVPLALATDCNPGTSWCESIPYVIQLACLGLGLGVAEAFTAATRGGALALQRNDVGTLAVGARGDLALLEADHESDLVAHLGAPSVRATVVSGRVLSPAGD